MLETVLKIGRSLRESPTGLRHHRYVKPCPQDTDKGKILRLSLPVNKDFSFSFDNLTEIVDENVIKDKLYYLTFKTSDADGLVKYIFGDIYYSLSKGEEGGYYRLGDKSNKQKAYKVSSFFRGNDNFENLTKTYEKNNSTKEEKDVFLISSFRREFKKNIAFIESVLKYQCGIIEYLDLRRQHKISQSVTETLYDEKKLRELTAINVFAKIKQGRGAKKIFKNILDIEEPQWDEIQSEEERIQKLINYSTAGLFLHFDFGGKHWYEFLKEFDAINRNMLDDFAETAANTNGFILKKYLYKTLGSAEKDLQFPRFHAQSRYRSKLFSKIEEISDLLYAIDYSKTALLEIPYTSIKIIVLPRGNNLAAPHYERFIQRKTSLLKNEQEQETIIGQENTQDGQEQLFAPLIEDVAEEIVQFDLIFSKQGGQAVPDVDMVEISGVEKSHLREIAQHINRIKRTLYDKQQSEIEAELKPFSITRSFLNILKDSTSGIKKYQNHLYRVLPQIYTGTYYNDAILLPALIEKTEFNVRDGNSYFNILKYDFYFLTTIQNSIPEGGSLMSIQESQSYKVGLLLGELARQFAAWRNDCPIKSFEKSYVGTLSRRITTIPDLIRFKTFIEEKLILHERVPFTHLTSANLSEKLKLLESSKDEQYDRHKCAFGFFESYFASFAGKQDSVSIPTTTNQSDSRRE